MNEKWIVSAVKYNGEEYYKNDRLNATRRFTDNNSYPGALIEPADTAKQAIQRVCDSFCLPFNEKNIQADACTSERAGSFVHYTTMINYRTCKEATEQELADWEAGNIPLCKLTLTISLMLGYWRSPRQDEMESAGLVK